MNTFYSIIQIAPNNVSGDKIAIGLVLFNGKELLYHFSDKKQKIANKLFDSKTINLSLLVKQFKNRFEEMNSEKDELKLFARYGKNFETSYFDYLHRYSQGLIQFSKPYFVNDELSETKFQNLLELVFGENFNEVKMIAPLKTNMSKYIVREKLIEPVKEKVHTNYKFSHEKLPEIYFQFEMDCIGANGSLIGAKHLDFDMSPAALDRSIGHYFTLMSTLTGKYNKTLKENHFFLISDEPKKINGTEHKYWESIKKNPLIEILPSEQSEKVAELIFEKDAGTFLD